MIQGLFFRHRPRLAQLRVQRLRDLQASRPPHRGSTEIIRRVRMVHLPQS